MAKPRVGQILDKDKKYTRDAIHVPIMEIIAGEHLCTGSQVYIHEGKAYYPYEQKFVGVVDPFIDDCVEEGDKFYLFLRPESTLKLWHEWIHPAVDKKDKNGN